MLDNLPLSLTDLHCSNNLLTSLPALPWALNSIDCSFNDISDLPYPLPSTLSTLLVRHNHLDSLASPLPYSLYNLDCSDNNINYLPALPSTLRTLDCSKNRLITIPTLPALYSLNCANNLLTSIPALPTILSTLYCGYNPIRTLPALPASLYLLDFNHDSVSTIPAMPATLNNLDCSYNPLGALPTLPAALHTLSCHGDNLTNLPTLPAPLRVLFCNDNHLTDLPRLPAGITNLQCKNNPALTCLPYITQNVLSSLEIGGTAIHCLPNAFTAYYSDVNLSSYPLCDPASGCDFYYNVVGNVHNDNSANCAADSLNPGAPVTNMKVRLKQGGNVIQQFYTFGTGGYSFKTPAYGSYTIDVDTTALPLRVACPQSGSRIINITAIDSVKKSESFGMQCSAVDFGVSYILGDRFRPTLQTTVHVDAGNATLLRYNAHCGTNTSGTVTTTITNAVHYVGPAPGALTPTSVTGTTLAYTVADLNTLHAGSLDFIISVDSGIAIGSQVCVTTTISPSVPDAAQANNSLTQCFNLRNSYDPNHKDVYPENIATGANEWLTYTIHFQNTGNDTAYLVVLRDTLSGYLDASSFQYIASSQHAVIQIDRSAMAFTFPKINLVDSATNPPLSEGWIQYRIRANGSLPIGTAIHNTAYIYFDSNPAIATNTATTNVQALAACGDTTIPVTGAICTGDTFTFHSQRLTAQGVYDDTLQSAGGCDSIIRLTLTVHTRYIAQVAHDTICGGASLTWHGQILTTAGTYSAALQSRYGCDSTVSLSLAIRAADRTLLADTICSGSSYTFYGRSLTTAGSYTDTLQNIHGCDSIIELGLALHPLPAVTLSWQPMVQQGYLGANGSGALDTFWCLWFPYISPISGGSPSGGHYSGLYIQNDTFIFISSSQHAADDTVTYTYVDSRGCHGSAQNIINMNVFCEVGIIEATQPDNISLHPNPNNGVFTLGTSKDQHSFCIITDMLGKVTRQEEITSDTQRIDMSDTAAGVYTLTVKGVNGSSQLRFVIVK